MKIRLNTTGLVRRLLLLPAALVLIAGGYLIGRRTAGRASSTAPGSPSAAATGTASKKAIRYWTCSMHPQIRRKGPGKCPICGMDLIPVRGTGAETGKGGDESAPVLELSRAARYLASIETAPAERRFVEKTVRLFGTVDFDETRVATITAWVGGRLDRLFVDYTGVPVREGDHLVWMYSPDILAAQEELLQALKTMKRLGPNAPESMREAVTETVEAAREKLRLWGLTRKQVRAIEARGKPEDHITLYAPIGGIVIEKFATEGEYVRTGSPIYRIADLTRLWVRLDVYERDLAWLRYGQPVEFASEAYPGRVFHGRIAFIDPVLNTRTRTVGVRVNVANPDGLLKPGMFVRGMVRSRLSAGGRIVDPSLAGKWLCPMHPEVVEDGPGKCPECGMPLVRASTLGYAAAVSEKDAPVVIPASAPLITGVRAVVYVQDPANPGRFEGRVVRLGPRAGDWYVVLDGVRPGELVVVNGNFKIDADLQIRARRSMMSLEGGEISPARALPPSPQESAVQQLPPNVAADVRAMLDAFVAIPDALSRDDLEAARAAALRTSQALGRIPMSALGPLHAVWMSVTPTLKRLLGDLAKAGDLTAARTTLALLTEQASPLLRKLAPAAGAHLYRLHCPMAFDKRGADWYQSRKTVRNPYFGPAMLQCGEVKAEIAPPKERR